MKLFIVLLIPVSLLTFINLFILSTVTEAIAGFMGGALYYALFFPTITLSIWAVLMLGQFIITKLEEKGVIEYGTEDHHTL